MRRTIYNTPVVREILSGLASLGLKLSGWKLDGEPPTEQKYVLIAVPHTSNWDFPITLAMAFRFRFELYWMGKNSLFKGPMGPLMKWMGGIPVDRASTNNVVDQMVSAYNASDRLVVAIPPEGTRSRVSKWKTGFYYIAVGAQVPIALGYLDYQQKKGGFGPPFYPTGDLDKDMLEIRKFYAGIAGKHEDQCDND